MLCVLTCTHTTNSWIEKEIAMCRLLDGHFDRQSNSQFRDGWLKNWSCSTMMFFFPFIRCRRRGGKRLCDCACWLSVQLLLTPGWSPHHHRGMWLPWQHHVGSTRSVQPLFLLFLTANWLTPPNNVFKAVFFTVWCLFSVPVAHAAVNRLLESCCFFKIFLSFGFVWSSAGAILRWVSVTGRCAYCQLSSVCGRRWDKCHSNGVYVRAERWQEC